MIFNSRKLRKALVSGLMAVGMGVAPVHGAGVFESVGQLTNAVVNFILNTGKAVTGVAIATKLGSTLAAKNGVLNPETLNEYRDGVKGYLVKNGYLDDDGANALSKYLWVDVEREYDYEYNNYGKWVYNDNVTPVVHETFGLAGLIAADKFKQGMENAAYTAGQEAGQKKGFEDAKKLVPQVQQGPSMYRYY